MPHIFYTHTVLTHLFLFFCAQVICMFSKPERRPGMEAILRTPGMLEEVLEVQPTSFVNKEYFCLSNRGHII